jgi:hypothetical protein
VHFSAVQDLEARVGVARGQLLEKDLVIEELSSLIAKLQASLAANRDVTPGTPGNSGSAAVPSAQLQLSDSQLAGGGVALARQVADVQVCRDFFLHARRACGSDAVFMFFVLVVFQSRIKEVTKQMMATVSELSMYQVRSELWSHSLLISIVFGLFACRHCCRTLHNYASQATAIKLGAETETAHRILQEVRSAPRAIFAFLVYLHSTRATLHCFHILVYRLNQLRRRAWPHHWPLSKSGSQKNGPSPSRLFVQCEWFRAYW